MEPRLEWGEDGAVDGEARTELGYFLHFFPLRAIDNTISLTNAELRRRGYSELRGSSGGRQELLQFVGIMMALSLHPKKSLQECFANNSIYSFSPSPQLSEFMTLGRFSHLVACMTHATKPQTDQELQEQGGFWAVQALVDAFNEQRRRIFRAGKKCCADESIFAWRGKDQRHQQGGCPHCTKILRKPQSVGMEIKNLCCCETGIMMSMEIVAGKNEMRRRKWAAQYGAGTSLLLRLTEAIHTTGRLMTADSAFASVKSAVALKQKGLHFMGLVKTAHKECPKAYLQSVDMEARGDHVLCTTTINGSKIRAIGWNEGKRNPSTGRIVRKVIVATCGTTVEAPPHEKTMWRNNDDGTTDYFTFSVKRPQMVEEYFTGAQQIDVHNHLRQGELQMEKRTTDRWQHRFFQGYVGVCEVDAYLAWKHFTRRGHGGSEHRAFLHALIEQLLNNTYGDSTAHARPLRPPYRRAGNDKSASPPSEHRLKPLRRAAHYSNSTKRAQKACRLCKKLASTYCEACTQNDASVRDIFAVCSPATGRHCFHEHQNAKWNAAVHSDEDEDSAADEDEDSDEDSDEGSE